VIHDAGEGKKSSSTGGMVHGQNMIPKPTWRKTRVTSRPPLFSKTGVNLGFVVASPLLGLAKDRVRHALQEMD
jgi:hypothetical protein